MPLWSLKPIANPADGRWQDHRIWEEVIARAPTAAMARVLAAELEREPGAAPSGNESLSFKSAFEDEKLYRVTRLSPQEASAAGGEAGPVGIVQARPEGGMQQPGA